MNILEEILADKRLELERTNKLLPVEQLKNMSNFLRPCISLHTALRANDVSVIAEIKKASPSKGIIRKYFDPLEIAKEYVQGGASALSVLTDQKYFQGNIRFIADIRSMVPVPILRKDFIIDSYQLTEAKAFGADAVLLIAAALAPNRLHDLHEEAALLGLECLVEVHHEKELESMNFHQVKNIGINNRDLSDFTIDLSTSFRIASQIPAGITIVSESGISQRADLEQLKAHGIHAALIGESLMRADHPGKALKQLLTSSTEPLP
jgi:indole-3-glycerol phosphate synthase